MLFVREKKVDCGDYREVDIIPRTEEAEKAVKGRRRKKQRESPPKQRELNSKNARRYLEKLANGNFFSGDLHVSLTYDATVSDMYTYKRCIRRQQDSKTGRNGRIRMERQKRRSSASAIIYR